MKRVLDAKVVTVKEDGGLVFYIELEGKRVAKRCYAGDWPGPWISLEPGYAVRESNTDYDTIRVEYNPDNARLQ